MPLVTCPDCGKEVSDAASACIGCGRPMEPAPAPLEQSEQQASSSTPAWECPNCGGGEFKKFSLLYEEHRSSSRSKTTAAGLGYGGGGFGVGVGRASSEGTSMTNLARRVSPPAFVAQSPAGGVIAVIIGGTCPRLERLGLLPNGHPHRSEVAVFSVGRCGYDGTKGACHL